MKHLLPILPLISVPRNHRVVSCLWIYLFWIFSINGIIQYMTFGVWLLLLSTVFSVFISSAACTSTLFLSVAAEYSTVRRDHSLSIHPRNRGCSTCWSLWTVPLQTCTCTYPFRSLLLIISVTNLARQLLGRMAGNSFFWRPSNCFPEAEEPCYVSTSSVWGF